MHIMTQISFVASVNGSLGDPRVLTSCRINLHKADTPKEIRELFRDEFTSLFSPLILVNADLQASVDAHFFGGCSRKYDFLNKPFHLQWHRWYPLTIIHIGSSKNALPSLNAFIPWMKYTMVPCKLTAPWPFPYAEVTVTTKPAKAIDPSTIYIPSAKIQNK